MSVDLRGIYGSFTYPTPPESAGPRQGRDMMKEQERVRENARTTLEDRARSYPFTFIYDSLTAMASVQDIEILRVISTFVTACVKRVLEQTPQRWVSHQEEWRMRVKEVIIEMLSHEDEVIRNNAALCVEIIGRVEFTAGVWPDFLEKIDLGHIERTEDANLSFRNVGELLILQNLVNDGFITPRLRIFDQIALGAVCATCRLLNLEEKGNENLKKVLKETALKLLLDSMHLWTRLLSSRDFCGMVIAALIKNKDMYRAEYYRGVTLAFKYYYPNAVNFANELLATCIEDLRQPNGRIVDALLVWTGIAEVELEMDMNRRLLGNDKGSQHLVLGVFRFLSRDVFRLISFPVQDDEINDAVHEMLVAFTSTEREMMLAEIGDLFRREIRASKQNIASRYRALFLLSCIIKVVDFELCAENLQDILECAESDNSDLKTFAIDCLCDIIEKWPKILELPICQTETLLTIAQKDQKNPCVYKLLGSVLKAFSPQDPFLDVLDFLESVRLPEAFEVTANIISLAGNLYREKTLETLSHLLDVLQEISDIEAPSLIPSVATAVAACVKVIGSDVQPHISRIIDVVVPRLSDSSNHGADFELVAIIAALRPFLFTDAADSVNKIIEILFKNLKTFNSELMTQAATFLGDLCFHNALKMENHVQAIVESFHSAMNEIRLSIQGQKSSSTLIDVFPSLADAAADVITGLSRVSMDTFPAVASFSEPVNAFVMGSFNDWSNNIELYRSFLRLYAAFTKVSDSVSQFAKPVFKLIKLGAQLGVSDRVSVGFVIVILSDLCGASERSLGLSGLQLRDMSVRYFLDAAKTVLADQPDLRELALVLTVQLFRIDTPEPRLSM